MSSQMVSWAGQFSVSFPDLLLLAGNTRRISRGQQTLFRSPEECQAVNRLKKGKTDGALHTGKCRSHCLLCHLPWPMRGAFRCGDLTKVTGGPSLAFFCSEP